MSLNVPIIDVHRENFRDFWPAINLAIQTASFISVDAELSGLGCRRKLMAKSLEDRYKSIAEVAKTRSVLSLGLSCFKLEVQDGVEKENQDQAGAIPNKKTFLVQTFNILTLCNEDYMVEPGALAFLVGHGFDFNKQYSLGIPYFRGLDRDDDKSWPSLRLLFNHLLAAKKPLTLHNGLVDLIFLYQNLYTELPLTSGQFVADLSEMYPGGVVDTKYVAEYEARMPASYLEYVFRRSQRDNELRRLNRASHIEMTFCQHSSDLAAVEYQSYALPPDFAARQAQGATPGSKTIEVCEIYAAHGHCSKGKQCPKSHDPDAILDSEGVILEEKRKRKRRRRNRKNRKHQGEAADGDVEGENGHEENMVVGGETEEKKAKCGWDERKEEDCLEESETVADSESTKTGERMDVARPTHDDATHSVGKVTSSEGDAGGKQNGTEENTASESEQVKSRPLVPKQTGSHRAGFDAFMTGFAAAAFMARFGDGERWKSLGVDSEVDRNSAKGQSGVGFFTSRTREQAEESIVDRLNLGHHANKLYLSGKEYPLAVTKSSFTKTSSHHRGKMMAIEKLSR